jgi:hypothetical protein
MHSQIAYITFDLPQVRDLSWQIKMALGGTGVLGGAGFGARGGGAPGPSGGGAGGVGSGRSAGGFLDILGCGANFKR